MFFRKAKDKLQGKPDGSYVYFDASGKESSGWMPPELLSKILRESGAQKLTRVLVREPDDTIREDLWPIDDETAKKFADHDGTVHVMSYLEDGNPKYFFIAKSIWVNDEELSRQYVRQVLALGHETCPTIAKAIHTTTQGDIEFPVNDGASFEISLAILGTSLAVLKGHSQVMTMDRGAEIEIFCKRSIVMDYNLSSESAANLNASLDEYQGAFQESMANKNNPFGDISCIMLCRCLGDRVIELCMPGSDSLNPFIHQIVGDLMTMTITQAMTFWKDK